MSTPLFRILRSPLVHFAVLGLLIFALASTLDIGGLAAWRRAALAESDGRSEAGGAGGGVDARTGCATTDDPKTICVERDALLAFIQSQTGMARIEDAGSAFDGADDAVRRDWIDRFVREEALVREARALGLDRADPLIRRRLVQQMEFLVEGQGEGSGDGRGASDVSEAEIEAAYQARIREFRHPATYRFAHVFTREFEGHEDKAPARAKGILEAMNRDGITFEEGYPYGDRFLYDRTYVDRTLDEIRSHFGDAFAKTLAKLEPTPGRWTGPYRSDHGLHLLMLVDRQPARNASLEEVRDELREALLREKRDRALEQGVAVIVARYGIVFGSGVEAPPGASLRAPRS